MPEIPDDLLVRGYRTMVKARRFDQRRLKLQRSGRIGTFAPVNGQEAAQVGTISALDETDWFVPSYRETAAHFWRGTDPKDILLYDAGYNEGGALAEDSRTLPLAVPVGTQMLHAVGIVHAARLLGEEEIAMTYFGDGATSQGDFHEAMNFASVFDCPVVFVCQNNQYAISVPRSRQTRSETLAQKAIAYGVTGIQVDGNDIFACHVAAREAVDRARNESRPTLIECVTYRLEMHTTADDPSRYRDEEEVAKWRQRDPIERFGKWLMARGLVDDKGIERMEEEITDEIQAAWKATEARIETLKDVGPMFDHVFAELTPELARQRARMQDGHSPGGWKDG
ncbi:pyruvate dehydrogenase (acetyl-transferring) E1 component subunit alpha [Defluviimonas sp. WL0002]|uniref:Pyruvate dehydrogenase E1 component subunit alpha n=1 Tax=Albidovulum marisflavi TaxID=2984159 RepID=A0ABT2ZDB9_9RHOB|nr:pyruvate dehydrogenase (acetyl-transferring) E1 component subunit alpha [Defluviimonas sp. WL0002]MCV2869119.1 pyruvate dehydrogenase (acetyl-transferring) E1 component subunit alpha [Defluviimonas sp. WL0002]